VSELNPVKHVSDQWRVKRFHNRVCDSLDALEDDLEARLRGLESDPARFRLTVAWR